ncbi:MAG: 2-phospho-L-lactate guanylyltransferase [Chloroflexota bacterium]|nr:2-phospho-L-lactate guanylyltransferase [Chloroflexota bacterium]
MSLWAIVPVKPLRRGKSRLSAVLSEDERSQLNHQLFVHTIAVLKQAPAVSDILVVSRDSDVLTEARELQVRTVTENGTPELNNALRRASLFSKSFSNEGILIVPADLPLMTPEDVSDFLGRRGDPPTVVIAPDRRRQGTNLLFTNPADLLVFSYGQESFERHMKLAQHRGAKVEIVENERIALDLDVPEDYALLRSAEAIPIMSEI